MDSKVGGDEPSYGQAMRSVYDMYRGGMNTLMIDIGDRAGLWDAAAKFTKDGARGVNLLTEHSQGSDLVGLDNEIHLLKSAVIEHVSA